MSIESRCLVESKSNREIKLHHSDTGGLCMERNIFKMNKSEKIILVLIFLLSISAFIIASFETNYPASEEYTWIYEPIGIFLIMIFIIRIFSNVNTTIYIKDSQIVKKTKWSKKTIEIDIKDVSKVIMKKNMIKIRYNTEDKERLLAIPFAKGMDLEDYQHLKNFLSKADSFENHVDDKYIKSNKILAKVGITLLLATQIVAFLAIIAHPGR